MNRHTLIVRGAVDLTRLDVLAARICMGLFIPSATIGLCVAVCEMTQAVLRFFANL